MWAAAREESAMEPNRIEPDLSPDVSNIHPYFYIPARFRISSRPSSCEFRPDATTALLIASHKLFLLKAS